MQCVARGAAGCEAEGKKLSTIKHLDEENEKN
jgi:hypothetical protein